MRTIRMSVDQIVVMSSLCSSNVQCSYYQIDIVIYVTSCYKLTPLLTDSKHLLFNAPLTLL